MPENGWKTYLDDYLLRGNHQLQLSIVIVIYNCQLQLAD